MNTTQQPVAIITGASSGIGLGVTQALLEHGWRVVATSRTISKSKDLKPSPDLVLVDGEVSKKETAVKVVEAAGRALLSRPANETLRRGKGRARRRRVGRHEDGLNCDFLRREDWRCKFKREQE